MDTLIIIRKIREAEVLADQGKHGDARKTLEPLLGEKGLSDNQRNLLVKKMDLFDKQKDRATRMMSRQSLAAREDDHRGDTTIADFPKSKVSDRKPSGDTTVPGLPAVAPATPTVALPRPGTRVGIAAPGPRSAGSSGDLQPLTAESDETDLENELFATVTPPTFDENAPTIAPPPPKSSITARDEPVGGATASGSITARDQPAPSLPPPPPPGPKTSEAAAQAARTTSRVVPMSPAQQTPGTPPRRTGAIRAAMGKSSADLRALAAELPANDISRDLALEVARLKDEVDRLTSERHAAAGSNLVKPESGVFKIPMSSANTVVRTAVGSTGNTDISVTMPSRSDNAPDLEVLRPGKVRKTEQVNLSPAQTIEEAGSHSQDGVKEDKLRQVAVVLAILVIVGLISYAVWWALQALAPSSSPPVTLTEAAAGTLRLGQDYKGHPALAKPLLRRGKVEDEANGWTAYIDPHDHVTAVMIPVGPNSPPIKIEFEQYSIAVDAKTSVGGVKEKFGEPVSYAAPTTWNVLRYEGRQGISAIEFVFSSADNGRLAYVRILDLKAMPWLPDPDK